MSLDPLTSNEIMPSKIPILAGKASPVLGSELPRYPHNLHPLCYLISLHEAYHQASIWHNQIHLTSRQQIEIDHPGKYDDSLKDHWKKLKFSEHREWKRLGKLKLKELEKEVFEKEKRVEHLRRSNVSRHKFQRLLKERMEKDWGRNYDVLLNGPKGVKGNALEVLKLNGPPLIALDYLWDLLEDPTSDPPSDCLYYYPGQRLTRHNGHQREPSLPLTIPAPNFMDLPRYDSPLPIVLSTKDTDTRRLLILKQGQETDVYAESMGKPDEPIILTGSDQIIIPQFDGSSESRVRDSDYSEDTSLILARLPQCPRFPRMGPLVVSLREFGSSGDDNEEAFREFGIEFLARMLQNPKYLFEMIQFVDQEEQGTLNTEELVRLIFRVCEWDWPPTEAALKKLAAFARAGIDHAREEISSGVGTSRGQKGLDISRAVIDQADEPDEDKRITPEAMLEILSKSFVLPCSGYYYDVEEAVFRALMDQTKAVVDMVRPDDSGQSVNAYGTRLDDLNLNAEVRHRRKELEEWLNQLNMGAKLERVRSKKRYESRAQRWKVMWNAIVRDGKDSQEVLKITNAPSVDEVLVEYIKKNPRKRPFPGAPAPRLSYEDEEELLNASISLKNSKTRTSNWGARDDEGDTILSRTLCPSELMKTKQKALINLGDDGDIGSDKEGTVDGALDEESPQNSTQASGFLLGGLTPSTPEHAFRETMQRLQDRQHYSRACVSEKFSQQDLVSGATQASLKHPHIAIDPITKANAGEMHVRIILPSDTIDPLEEVPSENTKEKCERIHTF